jgi:hypothetical protein
MDYRAFYAELFAPVERALGPLDPDTLMPIVGFDAGGPLNFCTIGAGRGYGFVTYISCELAVRREQTPSGCGRYELLTSCDDEQWVRSVVSDIGRMSLEVSFGDGDTLDIGPWVDPSAALQGVVFEEFCACRVIGRRVGVLRVIGVTRPELEFAQERGSEALVDRLKGSRVYPNTEVRRSSVI